MQALRQDDTLTELDIKDPKKVAMIEALTKALGVVKMACESVGISRQTHYNWLKDDAAYKAACDNLPEVVLDFAEHHLHKLISQGNPAATIFLLKTKGKGRGYVERQEIEVAEKKPLSWFVSDDSSVS
jgi:hypothetical protein